MSHPTFSQRQIHFDLLRVIAVFSVMLLHVAASNWYSVPVTSSPWAWFNLYDSLVRFCVPVFVMISGVFFLDPEKKMDWRRLLCKYIFRLAAAWLVWSMLYASYQYLPGAFVGQRFESQRWLNAIWEGRYHLWFLPMMIGLYLIVPFLRAIVRDPRLTRAYLILWLVFGVSLPLLKELSFASSFAAWADKLQFRCALGYAGYLVLGYHLNARKPGSKAEAALYALGVLGVAATYFFTKAMSCANGKPIETFYDYLRPNVAAPAAALFVLFSKRISRIRFPERTKKTILLLSSCSFGMYLIHDFFNIWSDRIGFSTLSFSPALSVPVIALCVFLGSLLLVLIFRTLRGKQKTVLQ